jgi:hypothetical protein
VRLRLARINLFVGDSAIHKGSNEAIDAVDASPFGLTIHLIETHFPLECPEGLYLGEIASCIGLASILNEDRALTGMFVHILLVKIALRLRDFVVAR